MNEVINACFGTQRILRKLENFTDSRLRKRLVELLVPSKLDYCDSVYSPLPDYLMKRLKKRQSSAVSFICGKSVNCIRDVVDLGWLPIKESRDFHLLKLTFGSLYQPLWSSYLTIQKVTNTRTLCSSYINRLLVPTEKGTYRIVHPELSQRFRFNHKV